MTASAADPDSLDPARSFDLTELGWDDRWAAMLATGAHLVTPSPGPSGPSSARPGRVARVDVGACTLFTTRGSERATLRAGVTVTVGDWVVVQPPPAPSDLPVVAGALPRRTAIVRRSAGDELRGQTLAANVDTVLVLLAADGRVTPRSVERYVTLVWESGATPVVVLTKTDLLPAGELDDALSRLEPACTGVALHAVSARTGVGLDALAPYSGRGRTVAFLGASGAGKSTLVNHLAGTALATGAVRSDGRGRHTTTHRELIPLPGGGVLVDTPGLREVGLWLPEAGDDGLDRAFPEITALVDRCRFADCSHRREPGCAVLAAVADGLVSEDRLSSWRKLRREADRLAARDDPALRQQLRNEQRRFHREYAQARKEWRKRR